MREALNRFAPQQRRFIINRYEKPRLHKELEFTRESYGPGDEVSAACKVSKIEGGVPLADQPVTATVQVDGKHYRNDGQEDPNAVIALRTDQDGAVSVRFRRLTAGGPVRGSRSMSGMRYAAWPRCRESPIMNSGHARTAEPTGRTD